MRFFCLAALLASASAFTSGPAAFTTNSPVVGERAIDNVVAPSQSHRNRRATIVMDGKANGTLSQRAYVIAGISMNKKSNNYNMTIGLID